MADAEHTSDAIDCTSVVQELYTFLDGELTEVRRVQITRHLDSCGDCHEVVEFHAELKMVISARCREQAPERLRRKIVEALGIPAI